jgi:hypothetical protein
MSYVKVRSGVVLSAALKYIDYRLAEIRKNAAHLTHEEAEHKLKLTSDYWSCIAFDLMELGTVAGCYGGDGFVYINAEAAKILNKKYD